MAAREQEIADLTLALAERTAEVRPGGGWEMSGDVGVHSMKPARVRPGSGQHAFRTGLSGFTSRMHHSRQTLSVILLHLLYALTDPCETLAQACDAVNSLARMREQHSDLAAQHAALQGEHERAAARNVTLGGLQVRHNSPGKRSLIYFPLAHV